MERKKNNWTGFGPIEDRRYTQKQPRSKKIYGNHHLTLILCLDQTDLFSHLKTGHFDLNTI